jgi:hypothetical protein
MVFERKIFRKIFGQTKQLNGLWRIKSNEELVDLIQRKNIIRFIIFQRPSGKDATRNRSYKNL